MKITIDLKNKKVEGKITPFDDLFGKAVKHPETETEFWLNDFDEFLYAKGFDDFYFREINPVVDR